MAATPTPLQRILGRLTADSALTSLLTGGIWDRELSRKGPHATLTAFDPAPGPQLQRPALVLMPGSVNPDAFYRGADVGYIDLFFYATDDAAGNGKTTLANAVELTRGLLTDWSFPMPNGTGADVVGLTDQSGPFPDLSEKGRIVLRVSVQYAALWRILG